MNWEMRSRREDRLIGHVQNVIGRLVDFTGFEKNPVIEFDGVGDKERFPAFFIWG